jgi:hypothetical protein
MEANLYSGWVIAKSTRPERLVYRYEETQVQGQWLMTALGRQARKVLGGSVGFVKSLDRALMTPFRSYTYCTEHPAECKA